MERKFYKFLSLEDKKHLKRENCLSYISKINKDLNKMLYTSTEILKNLYNFLF